MDNVKRIVKPHGHFIENRALETVIGVVVFIIGCLLLWDAWDGRGKKMPWPFGGLAPW